MRCGAQSVSRRQLSPSPAKRYRKESAAVTADATVNDAPVDVDVDVAASRISCEGHSGGGRKVSACKVSLLFINSGFVLYRKTECEVDTAPHIARATSHPVYLSSR